MKRLYLIGIILGLVLLSSTFMGANAIIPPNPPTNPMLITIDTAGAPGSVDPAIAYDTASGEMIFNVYDTLVAFNGEHLDQYIGVLADNWTVQNITGTTSPQGVPWYFKYTFRLRTSPTPVFPAPHNYALTTEDVAYSIWRAMILDAVGGPEWMFDEPLLNNAGGPNYMGYNMSVEADVSLVGNMIRNAIGYNNTHVWFNIAFPGAYSFFMQILTQTWSSIISKQFIVNQIIGANGTVDWNGNWAAASTTHPTWTTYNCTGWIDAFDVYVGTTGPLDVGRHVMYGSGPFRLVTYDSVNAFYTLARQTGYWRGWPANFPTMASVSPKGYVNEIRNNFGVAWATRCAHLVSGACDFAAIPRNHLDAVYKIPSPPYNPPTNYPKDGIRCTPNIPTLQVDAMFFTFDISTGGLYGPINAPGVFTSDGIPSDFFSNPTWGIHVRKGFAQVVDYVNLISVGFNGEGQHAYTALIAGMPYYDPSVKGYDFNLTAARAEFAQVPGIQQKGFTIRILWNSGNLLRQTLANLITAGLAAINSTFVGVPVELDWGTVFLPAILRGEAPTFCVGWLADFPDMHNFALPFYSGIGGTYPIWANYDNATIDAKVNEGAQCPDGPARQTIYTDLAKMVIAECPSVTTVQPLGRHFERDSIVGWYFNSIYPGGFYYNLWKWYYTPLVAYNPPVQPKSNQLGVDVNYDGKVNMVDIGTVAYSFGALAGPPIDPTWIFRCDINLDRKVDMKDIGNVAANFNVTRVTDIWVPTP